MSKEYWNKVKTHFLAQDGVQKQGESLKIRRKMFCMFSNNTYVVKLPKVRVSELLESKKGLPYDSGSGKIMKEWIILPESLAEEWIAIAQEGKEFALSLAQKRDDKKMYQITQDTM